MAYVLIRTDDRVISCWNDASDTPTLFRSLRAARAEAMDHHLAQRAAGQQPDQLHVEECYREGSTYTIDGLPYTVAWLRREAGR